MKSIILENIRSAYNVGNMIRTADALWYDVIISWYSPSPFEDDKVKKTSLWSENSVKIKQFWNTKEALIYAKKEYWSIVAAEICDKSISLNKFIDKNKIESIAIVFGNEVDWVLQETLDFVDNIVHIPMKWLKESLNVWQSSAIFMYMINNYN